MNFQINQQTFFGEWREYKCYGTRWRISIIMLFIHFTRPLPKTRVKCNFLISNCANRMKCTVLNCNLTQFLDSIVEYLKKCAMMK